MKVRSLFATIVKRLGYRPDGWEEALPNHPTLGDVDSPEALRRLVACLAEIRRRLR